MKNDSPVSPVASTGAAPDNMTELLRLEQTRLVYELLSISQAVAVLNALVFVIAQSLVIKPLILIGWFAAVAIVAVVRIVGRSAFQRAAPDADDIARWRTYAIAGAVASGVVWGSAAILLYPPMNIAHQVFVAFILGGMVAGSVTTLGPVFPAFASFAVLVVVPVIVRFAMQDDLVHYAMSWLSAVFLVAMLALARRSQRNASTMIGLKLENAKLTGELLATREKLRQLEEARAESR